MTTFASGFAHSCAISSSGKLYVWGDNKNCQLGHDNNQVSELSTPTHIKLNYLGNKYNAQTVACGSHFTMVVASSIKEAAPQDLDEDCKVIQTLLRDNLQKDQSLSALFGQPRPADSQDPQDPYHKLQFTREQLTDMLNKLLNQAETDEALYFAQNKRSKTLSMVAEKIKPTTSSQGLISMADVEDFALGYNQQACKLFAFGMGHHTVFPVMKRAPQFGQEVTGSEEEVVIVARPSVLKVPRWMRPIKVVACGQSHVMALTDVGQMYAWGCGSYGALGFGNRESVGIPQVLNLAQDEVENEVVSIACGKYHSMCITRKHLYTWGLGLQGRLGHNDEEDYLSPKLLDAPFKGKLVYISAGESHSACVSDQFCLYTWGSGQYGRLGHGFDTNEKSPKLVEDLQNHEIIQVSCGAFHTLAVSSKCQVFAFGQAKYGKLGINRKERDKAFMIPERVNLFKLDHEQLVQQDKLEAIQSFASYNHSLFLTKQGKLYACGYNGKSILGRKPSHEDYLPLPIDPINDEKRDLVVKIPDQNQYVELIQKSLKQKLEQIASTEVEKIACGTLNTVVLTNGGEVYVIGSNTYGQLCKSQQIPKPNNGEAVMDQYFALVKFPGDQMKRVTFIACGGEHIMLITKGGEVYGWGRNDTSQLGLGFISQYVAEPCIVKDISQKHPTFIGCSDDYSAIICLGGEVQVAGSKDGGKLGLGPSMTHGILLSFTAIPKLSGIVFLACGPNHMLAIQDKAIDHYSHQHEKFDGSTYAWGYNQKGQLGIGNLQDQTSPCKILTTEKFHKVACGQNFSVGLTKTGQVYFWGNHKYSCDKASLDFDKPVIFKDLAGVRIKDISVSRYQCVALNEQGEIIKWGKYMADKIESKMGGDMQVAKGSDIKSVSYFQKFDVLMSSLATGPNHAVGVSVKKSLYSWGLSDGGRLGLQPFSEDAQRARTLPIMVSHLSNILAKNKQQQTNLPQIDDFSQLQIAPSQKTLNQNLSLRSQAKAKSIVLEDIQLNLHHQKTNLDVIFEEDKQPPKKHDKSKTQSQMASFVQPQEQLTNSSQVAQMAKQKPIVVSISASSTNASQNSIVQLQRILKAEAKDQVDESSIIQLDDAVISDIESVIGKFRKLKNIEEKRKEMRIQLESAFLQRVTEKPFNVLIRKRAGSNKDVKKAIKAILTALYVHPCYLVKIFEAKSLSNLDFISTVKQLYNIPTHTSIYMVMTLFENLIPITVNNGGDLDFTSSDSVPGRLFRFVLKAQPANIDTLCSFGCHILNKFLTKYSQSQGNGNLIAGQDNSLDVTDSIARSTKRQAEPDRNRLDAQGKRASELIGLVEELIGDLVTDQVLNKACPYFERKKAPQGLEKTPEKEEEVESLRFTSEIAYMCVRLSDAMQKLGVSEEVIGSKLLGLIFGQLTTKIWNDLDVHLYPYIKSAKVLAIIDELIMKTHKVNLENVIQVLKCFFDGSEPFPQEGDQWKKELLTKLNHLQQSQKAVIINKILERNVLKDLTFSHFQNHLLHSLEPRGQKVQIKTQTVSKILVSLRSNSRFAIIRPSTDDPLYKPLSNLPSDDLSPLYQTLSLPTRLLTDYPPSALTRCPHCSSLLPLPFSPPDSQPLLPRYNPQDSQSLPALLSSLLTGALPLLNPQLPTSDQLESAYQRARKSEEYEVAAKVLRFTQLVEVEVQAHMMNRAEDTGGAWDDKKVKEEIVYKDLYLQLENQVNTRRVRRHDLDIFRLRLQDTLAMLAQKVRDARGPEIERLGEARARVQYGMANREMRQLAEAYDLQGMKAVIDYTANYQMSQALFKNLGSSQKNSLKSVLKKPAPDLLKTHAVTKLLIPSLKPLLKNSEFVFLETADGSINIKLVYREKQRQICGPPIVKSEAVLFDANLTQKEVLAMRRQDPSDEANLVITVGNAVEMSKSNLVKIINEMERAKAAYLLNSEVDSQSRI